MEYGCLKGIQIKYKELLKHHINKMGYTGKLIEKRSVID